MIMIVPPMEKDRLDQLRSAAPGLEVRVARDEGEAEGVAADAEVLYGFNSLALYDAAPRLRWVQTASAGVEQFPFEYFRRRGIVLTNASRIYGIQLADHTLALILAFSRQLPFLFRAQQRQAWEPRKSFPPGELFGERLLVVGLGGTGMETARRAHAFGMRVTATRRHVEGPKPDFVESMHPPEALHELLPEADWVAVCVPLTSGTRDLFSDRELGLMKKGARIICVTRGGIINRRPCPRPAGREDRRRGHGERHHHSARLGTLAPRSRAHVRAPLGERPAFHPGSGDAARGGSGFGVLSGRVLRRRGRVLTRRLLCLPPLSQWIEHIK